MQLFLGKLLRTGVLLAVGVVLAGGGLFLDRRGDMPADQGVNHGAPAGLRGPTGIGTNALAIRDRQIIQFGVLLLVVVTVSRILVSAFAFARKRDRLYVVLTLVVLAVLLYGLFSGQPE